MTTTTVTQWIALPDATGADVRFRADEPLGAGLMQVAASNATLATRENSLGTLWEHPGAIDVQGGLTFGTDPSAAFPWDQYPDPAAVLVLFAGVHRFRPYGETGRWPKVRLRADLVSDGSTAGVVLVARPTMGRPTPTDPTAYATTTAATTVTVELDTITEFYVANRVVVPTTGNAVPRDPPVEEGRMQELALYVGVWNGSGGKTTIGSLTIYLAPS